MCGMIFHDPVGEVGILPLFPTGGREREDEEDDGDDDDDDDDDG